MSQYAGFGSAHTVLRGIAAVAFRSFWHEVGVFSAVEGVEPDELVPDEGTPIIVVANHWNSAADVAVLSIWFPHFRKLHYWAKSTLFAPGLPRYLLLNAGNIPVDRKNKDNQKLFATTFDALKAGEAIAVFPEGGSETVPSLPALKDGASWAALEYAKNIRDPLNRRTLSDGSFTDVEPKDVLICVAGIAYTDKTKYRSCATMEFGPNISVEPYIDEFLVSPKAAVKKLTAKIAEEMTKVTVNAPDWESRHAATMARKILYPDDRKMPLRHLREIDQALIDLFAAPSAAPTLIRLKGLLNTYRDTLSTTALTHLSLSSLPLPATLDPSVPHPTPTRMRVFGSLLLSTLSCLIRLPFFLLPLLVHLPVYLFARYASSTALEEDQAQNKVFVGMVFALGTYATFFAVSCALLWTSIPWGGALLVALMGTILFSFYHTRLIDDNYRNFQRLLALWTVLIGLWSPIAHSEAHQFLSSVHPRLSLSSVSPRNSTSSYHGGDTPYADLSTADEDDEHNALLSRQETDDSSAHTGTPRRALPSPALFSEQDRLLGNFPPPSPARGSSHSRRQSRHVVPVESASPRLDDGLELTPTPSTTSFAANIAPSSSLPASDPAPSGSLHARRRSARHQEHQQLRVSRARSVRALLRLRVETVAALLELLFGDASLADDEDGELERTLDLSARMGSVGAGGGAGESAAGPLEVREAETGARRRGREVGEKLRGRWEWRGLKGIREGKLA
ncbi:hypothetical protein JCM8097_002809 [Rhodosporidiobolus ruineniae]